MGEFYIMEVRRKMYGQFVIYQQGFFAEWKKAMKIAEDKAKEFDCHIEKSPVKSQDRLYWIESETGEYAVTVRREYLDEDEAEYL